MRDALLVALFLAALAAPSLDRLVRPIAARDTRREGRAAAPLPAWKKRDARALQAFPAGFTGWFDDTCGLRDWLLRGNSLRQLEVFGVAPSPFIWAGRDGWWYYGGEDGIPAWRGLLPFRERELESWREALEAQRDWLCARGIAFLFVIGPNKETIYPEHVAGGLEPLGPTRLEQLAQYLRAHSDVPFLDLRPALSEGKRSDQGDDLVYCRLGTHWTNRGQWIAYREIVSALARELPALATPRAEDFRLSPVDSPGDSAAPLLYVPDDYRQQSFVFAPLEGYHSTTLPGSDRPGEVRRACAGAPGSSCLLLHDSFGLGVDQFLAENFRQFRQCTQAALDEELVEECQPEVVIELYVERKLLHAPPRLRLRHDPAQNRALFEASTQTLGRSDAARDPGAFEGLGGARVAAQPDGAGVAVTTEGPGQTFLTPPLAYPRTGASVLELVVDAEKAQVLDVFYQREGDLDFDRSRCFQLQLAAGANELYWRFDARDLAGRLRIRPRAPGKLVLRRLELRAIVGD